jgi:hypothetical protein
MLVGLMNEQVFGTPAETFGGGRDWLHDLFGDLASGMAGCRALMELDTERKPFATGLYRALASMSLSVARQLVLRQLSLQPEPDLVKHDPYISCGTCNNASVCERERRCQRAAES